MIGLQLWDITPKPLVPLRGLHKIETATRYYLNDKLVTVTDVLEEYGISKSFIYKHLAKGLSMDQVVEIYWWKTKGVKLYGDEEERYSDDPIHESLSAYVERHTNDWGINVLV